MNLLSHKIEDILWCHWDLLRFLDEKNCDLNTKILCVGENVKYDNELCILDYRIYLYKTNDGKFAIDVYIDENIFETLVFTSMKGAFNGIDMLPYDYPKYKTRPMRVLNAKTLEEIVE